MNHIGKDKCFLTNLYETIDYIFTTFLSDMSLLVYLTLVIVITYISLLSSFLRTLDRFLLFLPKINAKVLVGVSILFPGCPQSDSVNLTFFMYLGTTLLQSRRPAYSVSFGVVNKQVKSVSRLILRCRYV